MSKFLKLNCVFPKNDGSAEIGYWESNLEREVSAVVSEEDIVSFDESESLQKRVDELTAELEKVKAEKDVLRSNYDVLLVDKDRRIEELKERICIMSGEKETYKECLEVIVDKICENMR